MADKIRVRPCALYKCKNCNYIHDMPISVNQEVDSDTAKDMLSRILGRCEVAPRPELGQVPKYFICNCTPRSVGVAEFIGIEF